MAIIIQIILSLLLPYGIIRLCEKYRKLKFLGPIFFSYLIGIILGNIGLPINKSISMNISEFSIPLAIPFILFSLDIKEWLKLAKKTVNSFLLVLLASSVSAIIAGLLFKDILEEYWKMSGMMIGVYTGGTPNLIAIGLALGVKNETIVATNAADMLFGGIWFLLLISVVKPLFKKVLNSNESISDTTNFKNNNFQHNNTFSQTFKDVSIKENVLIGSLSLIIVGVSVGISYLISNRINVAIVMLSITTLGIISSLFKRVRKIKNSYEIGQYLILIFSLAIGMTIDIKDVFNGSISIIAFVAISMYGSILIHLFLAKIFNIDVDTMIITSTAGIYGPAFIGPIADAINNRSVIISGLTCGLVGYAVGNYIGIGIAYFLGSTI